MAQEQRSNLDLFQAQEDLENLEVDFNNVNLGSVYCQTYNLDVILNEIDMVSCVTLKNNVSGFTINTLISRLLYYSINVMIYASKKCWKTQ